MNTMLLVCLLWFQLCAPHVVLFCKNGDYFYDFMAGFGRIAWCLNQSSFVLHWFLRRSEVANLLIAYLGSFKLKRRALDQSFFFFF